MTYSILILPRASKELAKLPGGHYERTCDAIRSLSDDPRPSGCLKLRGRGERLYSQETVRRFEEIRAKLKRQETAEFKPVGLSFEVL